MDESFQIRNLNSLGFDELVEPLPESNIPFLSDILKYSPETIELGLGKLGRKFCEFIQLVDLNHPHISSLFQEMLAENENFYQDFLDLLELAECIKGKNLERIFGNITIRDKTCRSILKFMDGSFNKRNCVRLLKSRTERDLARAERAGNVVDLSGFYKKGDEIWESMPGDFDNFIRFKDAYKDDLIELDKRIKHYQRLGFSNLAQCMKDQFEAFKSNTSEIYYSFNRIAVINACIILAKMHKFTFKNNKICIPETYLGDCQIKSAGRVVSKYELEYTPKLYPYHCLKDFLPDWVGRTIDHLEEFPKSGGKPIFDNYAILVPNVSLPGIEGAILLGNDGECLAEGLDAFDKAIIKQKLAYSVLLGEKDSRCFFVSMIC